MNGTGRTKKFVRTVLLYMLMVEGLVSAGEQSVNFDELLEKTSYAALLKELIGLSDTIGLLRCRLQKDERRFVEDSILGKAVRVQDLFERIDLVCLPQDDVEYLLYWISLAKVEALPQLLYDRIAELERMFCQVISKDIGTQI